MALRVTNILATQNFIAQIFDQRLAMEKSREEVATGIRVNEPSDDTAHAATISQLQTISQRLEQQKQRIASATTALENQETVLDSTEALLLRARELAAQAANGTVSAEVRRTMAGEVFQIRDTLEGLANSRFQGVYIYGGAASDTPPFTDSTYTTPATATDPANTRVVFSNALGSSQLRSVQISDHESIAINSSGDTVFSNAISAVERLGRALAGYRTDPEDLSTLPVGTGAAYNFPNDYDAQTQAIRDSMDAIEFARGNDIVNERTTVGGRLARIEQAGNLIDTVKLNSEKARTSLQEVDILQAASDLSLLQTSLQALLASGSQINSLSLLNFL